MSVVHLVAALIAVKRTMATGVTVCVATTIAHFNDSHVQGYNYRTSEIDIY